MSFSTTAHNSKRSANATTTKPRRGCSHHHCYSHTHTHTDNQVLLQEQMRESDLRLLLSRTQPLSQGYLNFKKYYHCGPSSRQQPTMFKYNNSSNWRQQLHTYPPTKPNLLHIIYYRTWISIAASSLYSSLGVPSRNTFLIVMEFHSHSWCHL